MEYLYSWFSYSTEPEIIPITPIPAVARNVPYNMTIKQIGTGVIQQKDLDRRKLKHIIPPPRKTYYPPNHPVLQELLAKIPKIE